jgi:hypothetical protein
MNVYKRILKEYFYDDIVNEILKHYQNMKFSALRKRIIKNINFLGEEYRRIYGSWIYDIRTPDCAFANVSDLEFFDKLKHYIFVTSSFMQTIDHQRNHGTYQEYLQICRLLPRYFNYSSRVLVN